MFNHVLLLEIRKKLEHVDIITFTGVKARKHYHNKLCCNKYISNCEVSIQYFIYYLENIPNKTTTHGLRHKWVLLTVN